MNPYLSTHSLAAAILASLVLTGCSVERAPVTDAAVDVANATYEGLAGVPGTLTLKDGKWAGEPEVEGAASIPAAYLSEHLTTQGDMNGDGRPETATVVVTTSGGSGSFFNLVIFSDAESGLEQLAMRFLGDRLRIRSLEIIDGMLQMVSIEHGEDEPMCCPTQRVDREFALSGEKIDLVSESAPGVTWSGGMRTARSRAATVARMAGRSI